MGHNERNPISFARALLLAAGLVLSGSGLAQEAYSGPNDDGTRAYTFNTVNGCTGATGGTWSAFAVYLSCQQAVYDSAAPGVVYGPLKYRCATDTSGPGYGIATEGLTGACSAIHLSSTGATNICGSPGTFCSLTTMSMAVSCPANRALATSGALTGRCVSKCYSLRGTNVSAFVPIEDASASVPAACLFIAEKGQCQIEATDTSNYTYGTQLYRGGTWIHVGQQCNEDASSPPDDGAINESPQGGTGAGTGSPADSAAIDASKSAMLDALAGHKAAVDGSVAEGKKTLEGIGAELFEPPGGRWLPSFDSIIPSLLSAECVMTVGSVPRKTASAIPLSISFCEWAPYVQDFLYWLFGLVTMYGIWSMVFHPRSEA